MSPQLNIYVYRNCFTGDMSGGDMHTGGFCAAIHERHPDTPITLVHAADDGQEAAYPEVKTIPNLTYRDIRLGKSPQVMFLLHALLGTVRVRLTPGGDGMLLVAGSHFLPDVLPVYLKGGKSPRTKRMVFIHHIVAEMPRAKSVGTWLANLQERLCFWLIKQRFDYVITTSESVEPGLQARGFKQPLLVSTNFINNLGTKPVPYEHKPYTIVFCGRMVKLKGVDDVLATCRQLQQTTPDFRAVMMGVGPELDSLRAQAAQANLPIDFPGRVDEATKFDLLSKSKLFVFPSIEEGWGIAIAESLSVGTPVLAYDLAVYAPIFGEHIHTVPLRNTEALVGRAQDLLQGYRTDPAQYAQEQAAIAAHAAQFERDKVIEREYSFVMQGHDAI